MPQTTDPADSVIVWMWEHKVLVLDGLPAEHQAAELNAAGREGWELVTVLAGYRLAYLKRLSGEVGILELPPAAVERVRRVESGDSAKLGVSHMTLPAPPDSAPHGPSDGRIPGARSGEDLPDPADRILRFPAPSRPVPGGSP